LLAKYQQVMQYHRKNIKFDEIVTEALFSEEMVAGGDGSVFGTEAGGTGDGWSGAVFAPDDARNIYEPKGFGGSEYHKSKKAKKERRKKRKSGRSVNSFPSATGWQIFRRGKIGGF
jgi:hypothetical protein